MSKWSNIYTKEQEPVPFGFATARIKEGAIFGPTIQERTIQEHNKTIAFKEEQLKNIQTKITTYLSIILTDVVILFICLYLQTKNILDASEISVVWIAVLATLCIMICLMVKSECERIDISRKIFEENNIIILMNDSNIQQPIYQLSQKTQETLERRERRTQERTIDMIPYI